MRASGIAAPLVYGCGCRTMTRSDSADPIHLATAFARVADCLAAEETVEATLDKICSAAVEAVPAVDHCGVAVVHGDRLINASATGRLPRRFNELEHDEKGGPGIDAIRQHDVVQVDRLSVDSRWGSFARRAAVETGVKSVLVFPVFSDTGPLGVLQLYSDDEQAFRATARSVGFVFAAHVSVALIQARRVVQLEEAIRTRDVIGQAKGILMAQEHLTADEAFERLAGTSSRLNRKVRDIAEEVIYTGTLPRS